MKTKFILSSIILSLFFSDIQAQVFSWAKNWGGDFSIRSNSICRDIHNNVYSAGYFGGTVDFDPGPAASVFTSDPGFQHAFISKFDAAGNLIWVKIFQGLGSDQQAMCVKVDAQGNVFSTGVFYGAVDFDPNAGAFILNAIGGTDIFVTKLDSSGNLLWAKNVGAVGEFNQGTTLNTDAAGNVLVAGHFAGTVDFDPNAGVSNITATGTYDGFILKLTTAGNFVWVKNVGGNNSVVFVKDIEEDVNNQIVLTGTFTYTVDFDPGPNQTQLINAGGFTKDIFILKLNANGNFVWAGGIGDMNNDRGNSLVTDQQGNIFLTVFFDGTVDFNPGNPVDSISGFADVFVLKLNSAGAYQWVKSFGGIFDDEGFSIDLDSNGNIYTTGGFSMPADFDPGPNTFTLTPSQAMGSGFSDIFISKLSPAGNFLWATNMGDGDNDEGLSLVTGDSNTVYVAGRFTGTADFDPSPAIYNLTSVVAGFENAFLLKLNPCMPIQQTVTVSACHTYTYNGQTYTSSGTYPHNFVTANGCDSVVSLNLTITFANTNVTQAGPVLTANATGATYQWIKCNPYQVIGGATNQQLTAITNGDYAVIVTENGCTDTSACHTVSGLAFNDVSEADLLIIYPNPSHAKFQITNTKYQKKEKELFNSIGELIFTTKENVIDVSKYARGVYYLKVGNVIKKVIVE